MSEAKIIDADHGVRVSAKDHAILSDRVAAYDRYQGPRVGDFIRFSDGIVHQFSHDWDDSIQTTKGGSFYLGTHYLSFSGALEPAISKEKLSLTPEMALGRVWFFHHDYRQAHSAVYASVPFRVYTTTMPSDWKYRTGISGLSGCNFCKGTGRYPCPKEEGFVDGPREKCGACQGKRKSSKRKSKKRSSRKSRK